MPGLPEILDLFLFGEHGPKLMVAARDRRDAPTDVRLSLVVGQREPFLRHETAHAIIPGLIAPRGARGRPETDYTNILLAPPGAGEMEGGYDDREPDGAYSYVVLQTDLDLDALNAYYAAQLEGSGWVRAVGDRSGPQAWSTWTLRDERGRPWSGTFTVLRLAGYLRGAPERYLLQIHAGLTHEPSSNGSSDELG